MEENGISRQCDTVKTLVKKFNRAGRCSKLTNCKVTKNDTFHKIAVKMI